MAYRTDERQQTHDIWVNRVAKIRFPYPNGEHPNWQTYTNHPDQQMGIEVGNGEFIYPDIVVLGIDSGCAVLIGEVETEDSVTAAEAEQWREYSSVALLYLYVPAGSCGEAKRLATEEGARIVGFRYYFRGENGPDVRNCP